MENRIEFQEEVEKLMEKYGISKMYILAKSDTGCFELTIKPIETE